MTDTEDRNVDAVLVRLSALRNAHRLSLQDVCDKVEARGVTLSKSFLSLIETGKRRASPRTLGALAAVYGIDPQHIVQPPVPPQDRVRPPRRRGESKAQAPIEDTAAVTAR